MRQEQTVNQVKELLEAGRTLELSELLQELQPVDIAELFEELDGAIRIRVWRLLPAVTAAAIIEQLDVELAGDLLSATDNRQLAAIIDAMPADEVADLLAALPGEQKQRILALMQLEFAEDVQELMEYRPDSAGGLMTTDYVALQEDITTGMAIEVLRTIAPDAETVYYVYVINNKSQLVGIISLRELITAEPRIPIAQIMRRKVISVTVDTDQEVVARLVSRYDFLAVPVVNNQQQLVGIVTVDDVIDVIHAEATEDFSRMAGTMESGDDDILSRRVWSMVRARMPWLLVTMVQGIVASQILRGLESELSAVVALVFFIPLLTGMGGNVGTQSASLTVRGLATGQIEAHHIFDHVLREGMVGVVMGTFFGFMIAAVALVWQKSLMLGLIVGVALLSNIITAAVMGTVVPLAFKRIGVDPAVASAPFISTSIDITGLVIYSTLATMLISYLV